MSMAKRIEKLESMWKPQRHPRPTLVILDENDEPVNEHFAEVLRLGKEAEARGEDAYLSIFRVLAKEV